MTISLLSKRCFIVFVCVMIFPFAKVQAQSVPSSALGLNTTSDYRTVLEQEAFLLINQYRKTNKMPPLIWDGSIAKIARSHSKDMATGEVDFGHGGFMSRVSKIKTDMIGFKGCGENVFKTDDPEKVAQNAVAVWLKSPPHLHNIRGDFNWSGMGVWQDSKGVIYFTQIFVKLEPKVQQADTAQSTPPPVTSGFGLLAAPQTRTQP